MKERCKTIEAKGTRQFKKIMSSLPVGRLALSRMKSMRTYEIKGENYLHCDTGPKMESRCTRAGVEHVPLLPYLH